MEVKVLDVKGDKLCALLGADADENELDGVEGCGLGANVAGVSDVIASDGDASVGGIRLLSFVVTNNLLESNTFETVVGNGLISQDVECGGAFTTVL